MLLYILNIISIPIYALLIKDRRKFIILVAIQLFLILALREITVGVDLDNYLGGYNYISRMDFGELLSSLRPTGVSDLTWQFEYENGYTVLNWILSHMGLGFHGLLILCAAINVGSVSYFIYRYSKKPWISFLVYCALGFYMADFGLLRHSLALSMCLLSYCFLDRKRYFASALAFFLALCFHRTSILFVPMLLLLIIHIKDVTKKRFLYLLLGSLVVLAFAAPIYNNLLSNVMVSMGKNYTGAEDIEINKKIFVYLFLAIAMLIGYKFSNKKNRIENVSCYALIFTIWFTIIGFYNAFLTRALPFYSIFLILLIPDYFEQYRNQKSVVVLEAILTILLVGYMYSIVAGSAIDPYVIYKGVLS